MRLDTVTIAYPLAVRRCECIVSLCEVGFSNVCTLYSVQDAIVVPVEVARSYFAWFEEYLCTSVLCELACLVIGISDLSMLPLPSASNT